MINVDAITNPSYAPRWLRPVVIIGVLVAHAATLAGIVAFHPKPTPVDTIEIGIEREAQLSEPAILEPQEPVPVAPKPPELIQEEPPIFEPIMEEKQEVVPAPPPEIKKALPEQPRVPVIKNKPAAMPAIKAEDVAAARASYGAIVMAQINATKFYPQAARSNSLAGIVGVQFSVNATGQVFSAHIMRSSGFDALDAAALEIVRSIKLPPPPESRYSANTNIKFSLAH